MAERVDVLVIGGGPAGLAAAIELKRRGAGAVLVVEREPEAGGIPRLCHHTGFGVLDLRRVTSGPRYARHYVGAAQRAGVEVRCLTTITGWVGPRAVSCTSPQGVGQIEARAVLLATGCRERPRAARLVPGHRPQGVFTTGSLQRFVYEQRLPVGQRAVVVGAELVSLSALLTLGHARVKVAQMVTELPRHQIYLPYAFAKWGLMDVLRRGQMRPRARVTEVLGRRRVEAVEVTDLDSGLSELVACDTLVFTGGWIPEHELARLGGLAMDAGTRGPRADSAFRTSTPGVFAAGNLLRGAETADVVGLEGRRVGRAIEAFLRAGAWPDNPVPVQVEAPLAWVWPNALGAPGERPPFGHLTFRSSAFAGPAWVVVRQGEQVLHRQRFGQLQPNRTHRLRAEWTAHVDWAAPAVRVTVEGTANNANGAQGLGRL